MEFLICPSCNKEFELPLRRIVRKDDEEYMNIPRLLPCLHTICQSCLEAIRDRSKLGKIICPVCKKDDTIKGVKYLPLDVCSIRGILDSSFSLSISRCGRCAEFETSVSWCSTCSMSLCEFHAKDHEKSSDTAAHLLHSFSELSSKKMRFKPNLPPILCPDEFNQICTCYCFDCMHLVSSQAITSSHNMHKIKKCEDIWDSTEKTMDGSISDVLEVIQSLDSTIQSIRNQLVAVDDNSDQCLATIEGKFESLRKELTIREKALKAQVLSIASSKRNSLVDRLTQASQILDDCNHVCNVSQNILSKSQETSEGHVYLLGAAESIELRIDEVLKDAERLLSLGWGDDKVKDDIYSSDWNGNKDRNGLQNSINLSKSVNLASRQETAPNIQFLFMEDYFQGIQALIASFGSVMQGNLLDTSSELPPASSKLPSAVAMHRDLCQIPSKHAVEEAENKITQLKTTESSKSVDTTIHFHVLSRFVRIFINVFFLIDSSFS